MSRFLTPAFLSLVEALGFWYSQDFPDRDDPLVSLLDGINPIDEPGKGVGIDPGLLGNAVGGKFVEF